MGGSERIRVLIADDHPVLRLGLETVLGMQADMEVVGQAEDGEEAVRLARATRPDVVVLDARMPHKDGLAVLPEIMRAAPGARCLMLSGFGDLDLVSQAVRLGAAGFVLKDAGMDEVLRAIRAIYRGQGALDPVVTVQLFKAYQERQHAENGLSGLTPAEVGVLRLLARGLSNREIARELGVSVRTVSSHIRNILDKLGVPNRLQAALFAREHGLVEGGSQRSDSAL
jgi:DNA-binding NarL/FixJ family response regulator